MPERHPGHPVQIAEPPQVVAPVNVAVPQAGVHPAGIQLGSGGGGAALEVPVLVADTVVQPSLETVVVTVAEVEYPKPLMVTTALVLEGVPAVVVIT